MKTMTKYMGVFLATAITTAGMATASGASAAWFVRKHASSCLTLGGAPLDTNFSIQNDSTASSMIMLCPAQDATGSAKETTNAMNVHGLDNSSVAAVSTLACRTIFNVEGGSCQAGPSTGVAAVVNYNFAIPTNVVWTAATAADFGYVVVNVPPKQGAFRSTMRGSFQAGI